MKYEIEFDNNQVEKTFMDLDFYHHWSERNFEDHNVMSNIVNTVRFEDKVNALRLFGATVAVGTYTDDEFLRIGYARINDHVFVKNGVFNPSELKAALWEIAHP